MLNYFFLGILPQAPLQVVITPFSATPVD